MNEERIIHLCALGEPWVAIYSDPQEPWAEPVAALALIEIDDGLEGLHREVRPVMGGEWFQPESAGGSDDQIYRVVTAAQWRAEKVELSDGARQYAIEIQKRLDEALAKVQAAKAAKAAAKAGQS